MVKAGQQAETVIVVPHEVGIPPAPPSELDPYLDAAADVFARYGITRSSVQDIARRLGVNRATVYRQIGNVESAARLLLARETHRVMAMLPVPAADAGVDYLIDTITTLISFAQTNPVAVKVLNDEPELIGPFLATDMGGMVSRVSETLRPLLDAAMTAGVIARRDSGAIAEWITRIGLSVMIAPPTGDLREFLAAMLGPALAPGVEDKP